MSQKQAKLALFINCSIIIIFCTWGYYLPASKELYSLGQSKLVCLVKWNSFATRNVVISSLALVIITTTGIIFPAFVYRSIFYLYYYRNNPSRKSDLSSAEKVLLYRGIIITFLFTLYWSPYLFKILYEMITSNTISSSFDAFAVIMSVLFFLSYFILLFFQDCRVRSLVAALNDTFQKWTAKTSTRTADKMDIADLRVVSVIARDLPSRQTAEPLSHQIPNPSQLMAALFRYVADQSEQTLQSWESTSSTMTENI